MTPLLTTLLIATLVALVLARAAVHVRPLAWWLTGTERGLGSSAAPYAAGAAVGAAVWYVLGSLSPIAGVHDEAAYVLQAKIFAGFHWAAPARPIAEFFEQIHTLVTPVTAAKYPPAFSLALVPGIWLGAPALMVVLLSAAAGGMLFALARRFGNGWIALLATALWIAAPISAARAGYYSEVLTIAVWLAGWIALLRWRDGGRMRWLVALSVLVAFGALARPLTMVAYALPTGAATLWLVYRRRAWTSLAIATLAGLVVIALIPLWSARTTGRWTTTPLGVYTRDYLPYDKPGFTVDHTPPRRAGGPDMQAIYQMYLGEHEAHARMNPAMLYGPRLLEIARSAFGVAWPLLLALVVVALVGAPAELLVAASAAVALVLLYGTYAHPATWTLYYVEAMPTLLFLAAAGAWRAASLLGRPRGNSAADGARRANLDELARPSTMLVASLIAAAAGVVRTVDDHARLTGWVGSQRVFAAAIASLPDRSVVFVRYAPDHDPNASIIVNEPDLLSQRVWVVYDRGIQNARLMAVAAGRAPWRFDEAAHTLLPLSPADLAGR